MWENWPKNSCCEGLTFLTVHSLLQRILHCTSLCKHCEGQKKWLKHNACPQKRRYSLCDAQVISEVRKTSKSGETSAFSQGDPQKALQKRMCLLGFFESLDLQNTFAESVWLDPCSLSLFLAPSQIICCEFKWKRGNWTSLVYGAALTYRGPDIV